MQFLTVLRAKCAIGWANNVAFPPGKTAAAQPGFDPIIGQGSPRQMVGTNPISQSTELQLPTWVVPKGGEYFFSPSIAALKSTFALPAAGGNGEL